MGEGNRLCKGDQKNNASDPSMQPPAARQHGGVRAPGHSGRGHAGASSTADHLKRRQYVGMGVVGLIKSPPRGAQTPARGAQRLSPAHEASQAMKSRRWVHKWEIPPVPMLTERPDGRTSRDDV